MTVHNLAATTLASRKRWYGETDPRTVAARSHMARVRIESEITKGSAHLNEQDRRDLAALLTNS